MNIEPTFSERFDYKPNAVEITVREDAPEALRVGLISLARSMMKPEKVRDVVCQFLLKRPDPNNWSEGNIESEIADLMDNADWYKVYDFAEYLHRKLSPNHLAAYKVEQGFNQICQEYGIGWKMENGNIFVRGEEGFEMGVQKAQQTMWECGVQTARTELHEALKDISRRPKADVTGAIQHALAALECVARNVGQTKETLGSAVKSLNLPSPLDIAVKKLWGYASNNGRHLFEGKEPDFYEAELIVGLAASLSVYILRKSNELNNNSVRESYQWTP